ncbi:amidohydrolase [Acidihalobacter ferrooxydans]|uniref:Amidohydrolase n=2 Tax=Acidihalobacter ferrooxydans TaxID=1765967 RepID=A0A1P8UG86_9GAMM|nr:amidohydrolase [Acidihalobacter ferrooxydans]
MIGADRLEALAAFRRAVHRMPETGFAVDATADCIAERLRAAGLTVTTGVGGSGVVATLRRGQGMRAVGLRADLDALPIEEANTFAHRSRVPGRFHGCGHDGHAAMLLGAALQLAEQGEFDGTVQFVFQPDEESGRGAQAMIEDGLFERFPMDAIYGLHNLPMLPLGTFATQAGALTAFEELFEIRLQGRGGHASAPERTADPLMAAAQIVLGLQTIVSRALPPGEHGVVSVTEFVTDGARNVIPSTVTIRGDARGYSDAVSDRVERRMREIVAGVAAAHGVTAEVCYAREFEPLVNSEAEVRCAVAAARAIPGSRVDEACGKVGFSEDFARFLRYRPGCFVLMGNGTQGHHGAPLHNPHYDFNDAALAFGAEYWVRLATQVLGS